MKNQVLKALKDISQKLKKKTPNFLSQDFAFSDYSIGRYTYGKPKIYSWNGETKLSIGSFCSISEEVAILLGGEHRTDWVSTYPFNVVFAAGHPTPGHPATKGDIAIGNDVWIGRGAVILSGVTIGDGAVIAAQSVVTKAVEPYTIVGGNPARPIRARFTPEQVAALLQIAWWDWPLEAIREAFPLLQSERIDEFIARYLPRGN